MADRHGMGRQDTQSSEACKSAGCDTGTVLFYYHAAVVKSQRAVNSWRERIFPCRLVVVRNARELASSVTGSQRNVTAGIESE